MKKLILSFFILGATTSLSFAQDALQIKSEGEFRETVVGKKWTISWGDGWVKINPDGTFVGDSPYGKLKGDWYWKGRTWCRKGNAGSRVLTEDCQKFFLIGKKIMKNVTQNAPKGNYYYMN